MEQTAAGMAGAEPLGVILVGCGNRGLNSHGRLAKASPKLNLVAVCDVDEARVRAAAAQLDVPGERDLGKLLAREDVRGVIVATNAQWHVPVALEAVRAGKHILVEKPLADTAAAARDLAQAARQAGVVGMVGYQWRMNDFTVRITREAAAVEPLQALVTRWRGPFREQFFVPDAYGGIMDHMAHDLHLALLLMGGAPSGVSASVARGLIRGDQTLESANVLIEFEGGRRCATVVGSMHGIRTPNVVQVIGRKGSVSTTDRRTLQMVRHGGITAPLPAQPEGLETSTVQTAGEGGDATASMLEHFADLIAGRTAQQQGTTLEEGSHAVAVIQAAVAAAESGRRVPIELR